MKIRNLSWVAGLLVSTAALAQPAPATRARTGLTSPAKVRLAEGWALQSSCKVEQSGEAISKPGFPTRNWYDVTVPTTVVSALVSHKVLSDPFFGMNLRHFPGVSYPIGANFSNVPMDPDSPYAHSWWYRKTFSLPASDKGKTIWLNFAGINYRANIWLNGTQIAKSDEVAGAWRSYEFDITSAARPGAENVLAVQVYAPSENDLAITFVDWNPAPPDRNMGLWREVYVTTSGPTALRYPTVLSHVDASDQAQLTVTALLKNATAQVVKGTLKGKIEDVEFSQDVELGSNESRDVTFDPEKFSQLHFAHPHLWWPLQMGKPELYPLSMEFLVDGKVSDQAGTHFGIREVTSELNEQKARVFSINGKKILIRGGGWSPDMMLRENSQRLADEFAYVRDMGLNTIRLEGKLETEEFFDRADREGILVMAGWCCCDHWEQWSKWKPQDFDIAKASLEAQLYRLRSHPSLVMWLNGSDGPPPPDVEQTYLDVEKKLRFPNPVVSSASGESTTVTGSSGVKMSGPYEYVAPSYWTEDNVNSANHCKLGQCGGAHGFNTETSPGPAVPPIESLRAMLPKEHLWPIDDWWNFHAGGGEFKDIHVYTDALTARYGPANGLEDYTLKAQLMNYEGIRAMFEGYSRNKYTSTGIIQWMLNNAWPSMIWHLYDFYLRPAGGYFGAKRALEPLHPVYGYDDRSVWVVSSQYIDATGLKLVTKLFSLDMSEQWSQESVVDAPADSTNKILTLPELPAPTPVSFLVLRLQDRNGKVVGSNFYWLSAKAETLDWEKSNWYTTPTSQFADFTGLSQLPKVKLKVSTRSEQKADQTITHVTLENPSQTLAFFVRVKVNKGKGGDEILPVIWQDNYLSLLPGEKQDISATYRSSALGVAKPAVEVSGWNVQ
ncbi:MAG TPA: beta galactosidase jelly roll domain-containing protein [Terriglobales bacterium]|nr:beta galactosidase jelly roll domain-containing protein [Terriglobales bacterium]